MSDNKNIPDLVDKTIEEEVCFEWLDSNTLVTNQDGLAVSAGTCIRLNSQILFLAPLTDQQLRILKDIVATGVDHELKKRGL